MAMSQAAPGRDAAPAVLAVLLAVLALGAAGLCDLSLLARSASSLLPVVLVFASAWVLALGPARGAARTLALILASAPAVAAGVSGSVGPLAPRPATSVAALALTALALGFLDARIRRVLAAVLLGVLGTDLILAQAARPLLPDALSPLRVPLAAAGEPQAARVGPEGLRRGSPVRLAPGAEHPLVHGPGPWWEAAEGERFPGRRPVVLDFGAPRPWQAAVRAVDGTLLPPEAFQPEHALDLEAVDLVFLPAGAWDRSDARGERRARALTAWVRRGGLLLGPAPEDRWPEPLGPLLGVAGAPAPAGAEPDEPRPLGLGGVLRIRTDAQVEAVLRERRWVREVGTMLDVALTSPPLLPGQPRFDPAQAGPRGPWRWLWLHALALAAFASLLRGHRALLAGAALAAAATGLVLAEPRPQSARLVPVLLEVGGEGGRRVEAVFVAAGPAGFQERLQWEGGGSVRLLGGRLTQDGDVYLGAHQGAWLVRERVGLGREPGDAEARDSAWLRPLLVGEADPRSMRFGRLPGMELRVGGQRRSLTAQTLRYPP